MHKFLNEYLNECNCHYIRIDDNNSLEKIFKLFNDNTPFTPNNGVEYYYYGLYYHINRNDKVTNTIIKYYNLAINKNYVPAFNNLGVFYGSLGDDEKEKHYLILGVQKKCPYAAYCLAKNYFHEKDYATSEKYFLTSIKFNYPRKSLLNNIMNMYLSNELCTELIQLLLKILEKNYYEKKFIFDKLKFFHEEFRNKEELLILYMDNIDCFDRTDMVKLIVTIFNEQTAINKKNKKKIYNGVINFKLIDNDPISLKLIQKCLKMKVNHKILKDISHF